MNVSFARCFKEEVRRQELEDISARREIWAEKQDQRVSNTNMDEKSAETRSKAHRLQHVDTSHNSFEEIFGEIQTSTPLISIMIYLSPVVQNITKLDLSKLCEFCIKNMAQLGLLVICLGRIFSLDLSLWWRHSSCHKLSENMWFDGS